MNGVPIQSMLYCHTNARLLSSEKDRLSSSFSLHSMMGSQEDSAKRIRIHQKSDMRILADQLSAQGGVSRKELVLR